MRSERKTEGERKREREGERVREGGGRPSPLQVLRFEPRLLVSPVNAACCRAELACDLREVSPVHLDEVLEVALLEGAEHVLVPPGLEERRREEPPAVPRSEIGSA